MVERREREVTYGLRKVSSTFGVSLRQASRYHQRGLFTPEQIAAQAKPTTIGKAAAARIERDDKRAQLKGKSAKAALDVEVSRRQGVTSWRAAVLARLARGEE